jgi:chemotaxis response regulator CheB
MNKHMKRMVEAMEEMIGEDAAGCVVAGILDALADRVKDCEEFHVRSMKLTINGYFEKDLIPNGRTA